MSCEPVRSELVAYHFGTVSAEARSQIQAHLLACPDCLREFFAVKDEIETAASVARPSDAARARLRQAVVREVTGDSPRRPWAWWERPLAFGFACAAVFAAVFAVQVLSTSAGSLPHALRDESTAR